VTADRDDADAAAYAAMAIATSMMIGMVRGGAVSRTTALEALAGMAAKIDGRTAAHSLAAEKLRLFRDELAEKTAAH
jgi:hypothetical protein